MAYNQMESPPASAGGGGTTNEPREDTFYLPADFPGSDTCKPGDTITLRVVGKDEDGAVEVEHVAGHGKDMGPGKMDWKNDLRSTMGEPTQESE